MSGYRRLEGTDEIVWGGRKYRRLPHHKDRHRRVYYMATTAPRTYLHRDIYESVHGLIPSGWHVHHIDHDPLNNSIDNLGALPPSEHLAHHGAHLPEHTRECDECGQPYTAHRDFARWCSPACKERRRRRDGVAYLRPRNPMAEPRTCGECGADYIAKKPWAKYCSQQCRNSFNSRQRRVSAGG